MSEGVAAAFEPVVLWADEHYVIVDKPAGLLVHRSPVDNGERRALAPLVRRLVGGRVHAVHRLDKGTSGAVVFATHAEAAARLSEAFRDDRVDKLYRAVVRGWAPAAFVVDHALRDPPDPRSERRSSELRPAVTDFRVLASAELGHPVGRYATARYSLVECRPHSGRRHQIRRHLKHVDHPVIGDANYGDLRHNRFFRDELGVDGLLLANVGLGFTHPFTGRDVHVAAPLDERWRKLAARMGW